MRVKLTRLFTAGVLASSLISTTVMADEPASGFSDVQKKEIEKIIHDYMLHNPEILVEASQVLQQKQQNNMQQQAKSAIKENADQIFSGKLTTVGNEKGNVSIVEFFDYQCIHCKKMSPILNNLIKKDSGLRVVYKEFPIFGQSSEFASKAALAAGLQGKYSAMHDALLSLDKHLDEKLVLDTAKSVGLDLAKLKKDMESKEVTDILDANRKLADKLHLMGTPAFIIGATPGGKLNTSTEPSFVPGAASEESLQELVKKAAGN